MREFGFARCDGVRHRGFEWLEPHRLLLDGGEEVLALVTLSIAERGDQLGFGDESAVRADRRRDLAGRQRAVEQPRAVDAGLQQAVAAGLAVPEAEQHLRFAGGELDRPGAVVGRAVGLAVAVPGDRCRPHSRRSRRGRSCGLTPFRSVAKRAGAPEAVASRHPVTGLLLAEHDRVEHGAVECLDADRRAAGLLEIVEFEPDFERLRDQRERQRLGREVVVDTVQDESSPRNPGAAVGRRVDRAAAVLDSRREVPGQGRDRPGGDRKDRAARADLRARFGLEFVELRSQTVEFRARLRLELAVPITDRLRRHVHSPVADAGQRRRHPVVLALTDRVELVVVATSAVHRHRQERLPDGSDEVFELVLAHHRLHRRALLFLADGVVGAGDEETGRDGVCCAVAWLEHVAGDLQSPRIRRTAGPG